MALIVLVAWTPTPFGQICLECITDDGEAHRVYRGFRDEKEYLILDSGLGHVGKYVGTPYDDLSQKVSEILRSTWYPGCTS